MDKLISIIVPVYNVENEVKRCVDSITKQTYANLEILLIDDGSTDNSPAIIDQLAKTDARINVFHKPNGGLSSARNYGIANSHGEYIAFIDSDDFIEHDYVSYLYSLIKKDGADIAVCQMQVVYEGKKTVKANKGEKRDFILNREQALDDMLYDKISVSVCDKLYKREVIGNIIFPEDKNYEDLATTFKFINNADKISCTTKTLYNYIIRKNSITRETFSVKKLDVLKTTKTFFDFVVQNYPQLKDGAIRKIVWAHLNVLSQFATCKTEVPKEVKKQVIDFVKQNGKNVLKDKKAPKRDKIGITCLKFGFPFFAFSWKVYLKLNKKY